MISAGTARCCERTLSHFAGIGMCPTSSFCNVASHLPCLPKLYHENCYTEIFIRAHMTSVMYDPEKASYQYRASLPTYRVSMQASLKYMSSYKNFGIAIFMV